LKKPLVWKTLSKRGGAARKGYIEVNPGWVDALAYPVLVPIVQGKQNKNSADKTDLDSRKADADEDLPISRLGLAPQENLIDTIAPANSGVHTDGTSQ
jgi:hypothetical protein